MPFGFEELLARLGGFLGDAGDAVSGAFDGAADFAGTALGGAADFAGTAFDEAGTGLTSAFSDASAGVSKLFDGFGTSKGGPGTSTFGVGHGLDPVLASDGAAPFSAALDAAPAALGTPGGIGAPGDVYDPFGETAMLDNAASSATGTAYGADFAPTEMPINLQDVPGAAARTAVGAAPAGGAPTSVDNFMADPSIGGAGKVLGNNANILLPAGALAYQAFGAPKGPDANKLQADMLARADRIDARGQARQDALDKGVLPAGAQATIDAATKAAQAQIRQQFAGMGLSGSTMEQQALQNAANQAQIKGFTVGSQLAQAGFADTQLSSRLYGEVLRQAMQDDRALANSITRFAAAAAGGTARQAA